MKTIVIILSFRRSGSTILAKALGCHTKCSALGEINYFSKEINNPESPCGCGKKYYLCQYWKTIIDEINDEKDTNVINSTEKFNIDIDKEITRAKIFPLFLGTLFFNKRYSYKTINNKIKNTFYLYNKIFKYSKSEYLIDSTKSIFRALVLASHGKIQKINFKFIFLVRDGRAVLNSTQKGFYNIKQNDGSEETTYVKIRNPKKEINKWKFTNILYLIILKLFRNTKYIKVKHEDFCNHPNETLEKICNFLDITYEPAMVQLDNFENHILGGNTSRMNAKEIKKSKENWREKLNKDLLLMFNKNAGWVNKLLGFKN